MSISMGNVYCDGQRLFAQSLKLCHKWHDAFTDRDTLRILLLFFQKNNRIDHRLLKKRNQMLTSKLVRLLLREHRKHFSCIRERIRKFILEWWSLIFESARRGRLHAASRGERGRCEEGEEGLIFNFFDLCLNLDLWSLSPIWSLIFAVPPQDGASLLAMGDSLLNEDSQLRVQSQIEFNPMHTTSYLIKYSYLSLIFSSTIPQLTTCQLITKENTKQELNWKMNSQ